MNSYSFSVYGHAELRGTHRNTLEFSTDRSVSSKGSCIVGLRADFSGEGLKAMMPAHRLRVRILAGGIQDEVHALVNNEFADDHEIVIRKSDFVSPRTLGIEADKGSSEIDRRLITYLQDPSHRAKVTLFFE